MPLIYEKKKIRLSFKGEKPEVYCIKPVRQQAVSFEDLMNEVSNSCGVNRSQTKAVLEALIDRMIVFMNYGMPVRLGEFGTFKPTFNAKSTAKADEMGADNVTRKKLLFYPGKRFKQMLSGMSVTTLDDPEEIEDTSGGSEEEGGGGESPM